MDRRSVLRVLLVVVFLLNVEGASIALGGDYSCALLADGTMKCWGSNDYGQLGDGTTTNSTIPVEVSGITTATSIAMGRVHSCALLTDGTVKCWGRNNMGQLGDNTTIDASYTISEVSGITTATSVALGVYYHSCAVLTDGKVRCWGNNDNGQLGLGEASSHKPTLVDALKLGYALVNELKDVLKLGDALKLEDALVTELKDVLKANDALERIHGWTTIILAS